MSLLLGLLSLRVEWASGTPRLARIAIGALVGLVAAAVTTSIGLDVIPDSAEGGLVDLFVIILGALAAIVLVARRMR
jgi:hypothetical protein